METVCQHECRRKLDQNDLLMRLGEARVQAASMVPELTCVGTDRTAGAATAPEAKTARERRWAAIILRKGGVRMWVRRRREELPTRSPILLWPSRALTSGSGTKEQASAWLALRPSRRKKGPDKRIDAQTCGHRLRGRQAVVPARRKSPRQEVG